MCRNKPPSGVNKMHVTFVSVSVKEDHVEDFLKATIENHHGAVKEPGNLRFDILQNSQDPCAFVLYEAYESDEAAAAHKQTEHYLKWRETVADWMARPREGNKYKIRYPVEKSAW